MVRVEAALIALQATSPHDALLVEVVERRPILRLLGAAGEGEVVVGRDPGPEHRVLPVGVHGTERRERIRWKTAEARLLRERIRDVLVDLLLDEGAILLACREI